MASQNQYTTMSAAATIAPIVLWSDRCEGNLYLAGKNTFLEFYTDENKAVKRSGMARSASADSRFNSSDRSGRSTATPTSSTNRSTSPSNRSLPSSDNEIVPNADWRSPCTTPREYNNPATYMATSPTSSDNSFDISAVGYPFNMPPMMMPVPPCPTKPNEGRKVRNQPKEPKVVKPRNVKIELANQGKPSKKKDLKKFHNSGGFPTEVTTMMFRGIPCSFTQEALICLIDDAGFKNKYNFFYLPRDGNRSSNLGYAFINFVDQQSAENCKATFEGVPLSPARSQKTCTISAADIQGLPSLWKHFRCTAVSRGSHGPMFLKV